MRIEHIAVYTAQLEEMRYFYMTYFKAIAGEKYSNHKKGFESYFLHFDGGARLELMQKIGIDEKVDNAYMTGFHHMAISVGSKTNVDLMTNLLKDDGYTVEGEPRTTGDGYYESIVLDPDGNKIEITV